MADGGLLPRLTVESARKSFGTDRAAASDPSKLESAAEEQQNELEALQSIYGELSDREAKVPGPKSGVLVLAAAEGVGPRVFDVAITAEDNPDAKPGDAPASCMLRVAYSPLYPDSAPLLEIVGPFGGFRANEGMRDRMVSGLSDLSRRNVGMSHVHLLVDEAASRLKDEARLAAGGGGSLYEQLMRKRDEERAAVEAAEKEAADAKKRAAADELERQARASRSVAGLSQARRDDADEEDDEDGLAARARRGWGTQVTKESFAAWRLGFFRQKVQAFVDGDESLASSERMAAKLDGEGGDGEGEGEGDDGEGGAAAGGAAKSAAYEAREAAVEEFENTSKLPVPPTEEEARDLWKRAADKGMVEGGLGTLVVGGLVVPGSRLPPIMGKMQGEPVSASTGKQHFLDQAAKGGAGTMAVGADQAAALAEAAAALRAKDAAAAAAPVIAGDTKYKQAGAPSSASSKPGAGAGGAAGGASLLEGVDVGLMEAVAAGLGEEGDLDLDLEDDDDLDDDDLDDDDGGDGSGASGAGAGASSGAGAGAPAPAAAPSASGGNIERSVSGSTGAMTPGGNSAAGEADYRAMLVRTAIEGAEAAARATGTGREVLVSAVERAKTQLEELRKEAEEDAAPASAAPAAAAEAGAGAGQSSAKEADEGGAGGDAASRRERRRARRAKRKEKKAS